MKGEMVPLTVGPSAPKAKVFLSFSPLAAITGSRRSCSCWIQWIINFRSLSRSPALYLTQVCGHGLIFVDSSLCLLHTLYLILVR